MAFVTRLACSPTPRSIAGESSLAGVCAVCRHPSRDKIDRALVAHTSFRTIVKQHGTSPAALSRHKGHLSTALVKSAEARQAASATSLFERVEQVIGDCRAIAERANKAKSWASAVAALREVRGCLELLGKLSGELGQSGNGTSVHVSTAVQYGIPAMAPYGTDEFGQQLIWLVKELLATDDVGPVMRMVVRELDGQSNTQEATE